MAGKPPILKRDFFKKKSNANYKYFLWAAIGLVILVVITPLLTHRRSDKAPSEKVAPETGVVMKEIPRSSSSGPETGQPLQGNDSIAGIKEENLQPGSTAGRDIQPEGPANQPPTQVDGSLEGTATGAGEPQPEQIQTALPAQPQPEQTQTASPADPQTQPAAVPEGAGSAAAKQPAASPAIDETAAKVQQEAVAKGDAASAQQAPVTSRPQPPKQPEKLATGNGTKYIVQIGSFSQKKNADSIQQDLLKRGYQVTVRITDHAKFGRLYVVQLSPVYDSNKAEALLAKVRKEANVNPMMVKIPAGQ